MSGRKLAKIAAFCGAISAGAMWAATDGVRTFSGTAPGSTGEFQFDGPWMVSWTAASEFPQLAFVELLLYDADTDRFLGLVAQRDGTGQAEKIIPQGGTYRIVVTGRHVDWTIGVEPVTEEVAALMKAHPELERIQLVEPDTGLSPALVRGATGWRADGETAILLTTSTGSSVRVPFHEGAVCPGLGDSRNVFFVTAGYDAELFNAILLENGRRCYLSNPVPLVEAQEED